MATIQFTNSEIAKKQNDTIFKLPASFSWGGPKFDAAGLKLVISYILSDNECINKRIYKRLCEYFDEAEVFYGDQNDPLLKKLCNLAKGALEARIGQNLSTRERIIMDMHNRQALDFDEREYGEITTLDVNWIETFASNIIDDLNTSRYMPKIRILNDRISAAAISDRPAAITALYDEMSHMVSIHNELVNDVEESSSIVFADNEAFDQSIESFIMTKTNDSEKLRTGIRALNGMLGGGFERKRVYAFMGIAGTGKSLTLLDLLIQVRNHNPHIVPKDKNKVPILVMLTMENSKEETIERLINMVNGPTEWKSITVDVIKDLLRKNGMFPASLLVPGSVPSEYDTMISIEYKAGDSVDTSYLYDLYEELDRNGYEMQALFMDYIARIRTVSGDNKDLIARLGAVANEFKVFATAKDIPIITAAQINRTGALAVSERRQGRCSGNSRANLPYDLVTSITSEHIGDSHKLIHNIDVAIAIVPEFEGNNEANRKWLGCKVCKSRNATAENTVCFIPYDDYKKAKLMEDPIQGMPVTRWSMSQIYSENKGLDFVNTTSVKTDKGIESMDSNFNKSAVAEKPKQESTTFFNMKSKMDDNAVAKSIESFFVEEPKIDMEALKMERMAIVENVKRVEKMRDEYNRNLNRTVANNLDPLFNRVDFSVAANVYPQHQMIRPFTIIDYSAQPVPNMYPYPQYVQPVPQAQPLISPFTRITW